MNSSKIEKATLSANFEIEIVDDELQLNFASGNRSSENSTYGKLEIVISPHETTEGLNLIIDGYANNIKRQISYTLLINSYIN